MSEYLSNIMQSINFEILSGYNYRGLSPRKGISRLEFKKRCNDIINTAVQACIDNGGTEDDIYECKKHAMRQISEQSLFFFCITILEMKFADNDFVYRLCQDVQANKWNRLWVIAREHFKTTIITEASTLWEVAKNPELTILINSYNIEFSTTCVTHIKTYCENCKMLYELYPETFWKDPARGYEDNEDGSRTTWTWTKSKIELKRKNHPKEMTIEAGAIEGAGQTGGHFARIIYDDAETPKTVETAQSIVKAYNKVMLAINTGKTEDLNICFVGTFYARDDMYVMMIKNNVVTEAVIQPCCEKDGTPICYSETALIKKIEKMGPDASFTQMFCDPSVSSSSAFDPKWIKWWQADWWEEDNVYVVVDPAGSKQKNDGDYMAIAVIAIDTLGNIKILDFVRDKLRDEQKFAYLLAFNRRYRPIDTFYEEISMQSDIALMYNYMEKYKTLFSITPYSMSKYGSKVNRIKKLSTPFSHGKIWFAHSYHTNYLGKEEDMMMSLVRDEYLAFPQVQHDDGLDVLSSAYILFEEGKIQAPLEIHTKQIGDDKIDYYYMPTQNRFYPLEEATYADCFDGI